MEPLELWIDVLLFVHAVNAYEFCSDVLTSSVGICPGLALAEFLREKRKRSDSVLWQKPLHQQRCQKGKIQHKQHHKQVRLHSGCGPTYDGQLE